MRILGSAIRLNKMLIIKNRVVRFQLYNQLVGTVPVWLLKRFSQLEGQIDYLY